MKGLDVYRRKTKIVEVLCTLPESEDKNELVHRVTIASKRSNKLSKLLRKEGLV